MEKKEFDNKLLNCVNNIVKHRLCPNCAGTSENGVCLFCGKENKNIKEGIDELSILLNNISPDILNCNKVDDTLSCLYRLNEYGIPSVNNVLSISNYPNIVISRCNYINSNYDEIINGNIILNKEDYNLLLSLPNINDYISDEHIVKICSKGFAEDNSKMEKSDSNKRLLVEKFASFISKKDNYNSTIKVNFEELGVDTKVCDFGIREASYGFNTVNITPDTFKKDIFELYSTIFHELIHQRQDVRTYRNKEIGILQLSQIEDHILFKELGKDFYYDNYVWNSCEMEAHLLQYHETMQFFQDINVKIPQSVFDNAQEKKDFFSQFFHSNHMYERIHEGKWVNMGTLFSNCIYDKPKYLKIYPQLEIFYKLDGDHVLMKSLEELETEYKMFKSGELKYNGKDEEIDILYKNTFDAIKMINSYMSNNNQVEKPKAMGFSEVGILFFTTSTMLILCSIIYLYMILQ